MSCLPAFGPEFSLASQNDSTGSEIAPAFLVDRPGQQLGLRDLA